MMTLEIPVYVPITQRVVRKAKMEVMRCLAYWILMEAVIAIVIAITSVAYLDSKVAIIVMISILTLINAIFSYNAFHRSTLLHKLVQYIKLSRQYEQSKDKCIVQLEDKHAQST